MRSGFVHLLWLWSGVSPKLGGWVDFAASLPAPTASVFAIQEQYSCHSSDSYPMLVALARLGWFVLMRMREFESSSSTQLRITQLMIMISDNKRAAEAANEAYT